MTTLSEDVKDDWTCQCGARMVTVGHVSGQPFGSVIHQKCRACGAWHELLLGVSGARAEDFITLATEVWVRMVRRGEVPSQLRPRQIEMLLKHSKVRSAGRRALASAHRRRSEARGKIKVGPAPR